MSSTADREGQTSQSGLSIVLPTFNEGGSIRQVIESLLQLGGDHPLEILVVDDDSRDGTPDLVRALARQDPRIRIIQRVGRSGLASAIKEGLIAALYSTAVVMDSDGQHEPSSVGAAPCSSWTERGWIWWRGAASLTAPKSMASATDAPMAPASPTVWPVGVCPGPTGT